jgi:hypothetical protein
MSSEFFIVDANEWLKPPEKHKLTRVVVVGGYLRVSYEGETEDGKLSNVDIFLNDHGQEVTRTVFLRPVPEPLPWGCNITPPLSWWERLLLYLEVNVFGRF